MADGIFLQSGWQLFQFQDLKRKSCAHNHDFVAEENRERLNCEYKPSC